MPTESDVQIWLAEVFGAFPDSDTIQPIDYDEYNAMSDDEKRSFLGEISEEAQGWLLEEGDVEKKISSAEALDYYMVNFAGFKPSSWAQRRDVNVESVRKNVRQANTKLQALKRMTGENYLADDE